MLYIQSAHLSTFLLLEYFLYYIIIYFLYYIKIVKLNSLSILIIHWIFLKVFVDFLVVFLFIDFSISHFAPIISALFNHVIRNLLLNEIQRLQYSYQV